MSNEAELPDEVQGERGIHSVSRTLSLQSRAGNVLAVGLMSVLGLGSLTWYYANTLGRQGRAKRTATAVSASRAQGDLPLPGLGRIDPPQAPAPEPAVWQAGMAQAAPQMLTELPAMSAPPATVAPSTAVKTPSQLARERELAGAVFAPRTANGTGAEFVAALPPGVGSADGGGPGALTVLLNPTVTAAVHAQRQPARRLLLPKGAFLDCTLETAIDSTLPGMTTCVMATDAFGVDGTVVLLERGTKLIGETRGQVAQGTARVFVLWTEARTPTGVIVPLDSPGADELGRSGLPGEVNRHFWQRFGAAMLVSVIDGVAQAAAQSSGSGSSVVVNPSTPQDVLGEVLKSTVNIAPTVNKRNGDRIQVFVARDLDFRSVYELRAAAADRE